MQLDRAWINRPTYPDGHAKITLKAIYEDHETDDSDRHNIWPGRMESKVYNFTLTHR